MATKVQRGGIIRKNDNGTLERIDGTHTYIGSATLENGRVITKRFRCKGFDEEDVARRWETWQCRKDNAGDEDEENYYKEEDMANEKTINCPFNGNECTATCPLFSIENQACSVKLGGIGLYNMSTNLMKLDASEPIEMVAMAVGELGSAMKSVGNPVAATAKESPVKQEPKKPTEADGVNAFLDGKTFLNFVNLHGKAVNGQYVKFCHDNGYPVMKESELISRVAASYPELKRVKKMGGSVFEAA